MMKVRGLMVACVALVAATVAMAVGPAPAAAGEAPAPAIAGRITATPIADPFPAHAGQTSWSLDTYGACTSVLSAQPSPSGRRVVYTLERVLGTGALSQGNTRAYVAAADGSARRPLTTRRDSSAAAWSSDGRFIAFLSTKNGVPNVWVVRATGGAPRQVTRAVNGVTAFAWSPSGAAIAYVAVDTTSAGDGPVVAGSHPVRANLWQARRGAHGWFGDRSRTRRLTNGDFVVGAFDWSPDGRTIAWQRDIMGEASSTYDSDVLLLDVASRQLAPVATSAAAETSPRYSPDGSRIAFVRSDLPASDFSAWRVVLVPAAGGAETVLAATPNEHPLLVGWARDGRALYFAEQRRTSIVLSLLPADGTASRDLTEQGDVISPSRLSPGGKWMAIGLQSWSVPQELSLTGLPADSSAVTSDSLSFRQVTHVNRALKSLTAPRQEVVSWTSDGLTIEGLLTYPVGYEAGKRYPLILYVHGGPCGAFIEQYAGSFDIYPVAVFARRGYAVLRINPRGSDAYGAAFRKANIQDFGGGDYRDLMRGVDKAVDMGVADAARLGVMGWSYGGFMSAWITTQTDRFVAASVGAGPVDWTSMAGTDNLPTLVPDYLGGMPWQVPEVYARCSPVTYAANVRTPTLIQHGLCDTRVPYSQGQEWYWTLQNLGVTVQMVSYPRSQHVVMEPGLVRDVYQRNLDWFAGYLPAGGVN